MLIHYVPPLLWTLVVYIIFSVVVVLASAFLPIETKGKDLDDVVEDTLLAFETQRHPF